LKEIAEKANLDRLDLTSKSFYKVKGEGFNFETQTGEPYMYYTTGVACSEVEIIPSQAFF
jgi:xanthine dehydrogenase molybdopterin-binding subunit B